jgi:hypothetical protein
VPTEGWFRFRRRAGLEPVLVSHEVGALYLVSCLRAALS